jgi:hypothetical protein
MLTNPPNDSVVLPSACGLAPHDGVSHEANMKPILSVALCAGLLWLAGCRSDPNRELLERELRDHEDEIYDLQNQLEDKCHELEACRHENASLKKGTAADDGDGRVTPPPRPQPPAELPSMPKIDLGTPESSPPLRPSPSPKKSSDLPGSARKGSTSVRPAALDGETVDGQLAAPRSSGAAIERLAMNHLMTGGHSFSGQPGDDGLLVVFGLRDRSGQAVQADGEVSIVAIDPQISGDDGRLARWDFSAPEAAAHFRNLLTAGYHFDLLWPNHPPRHNDLKLFVRMTTADGHRFEDSQAVHIRLPGDSPTAQNWAKPEAPNRWSAVTLPNGAQFNPNPPRSPTPLASRPPVQTPPPVDSTNGDDDPPPPRKSSQRPEWSPYR